jgi:hypothetical protein
VVVKENFIPGNRDQLFGSGKKRPYFSLRLLKKFCVTLGFKNAYPLACLLCFKNPEILDGLVFLKHKRFCPVFIKLMVGLGSLVFN